MSGTPVVKKQPAEVRLITFDFGTKLVEGDTVATVVGNALELIPAGTMTAGLPSRVEAIVTALLTGGTVAVSAYRVSCRVTTTLGETLELDCIVRVEEGAN